MNGKLRKLLRKIILFAFKDVVQIYQTTQAVSNDYLIRLDRNDEKYLAHVKRKLIMDLADRLYEHGAIEIIQEEKPWQAAVHFTAKIYLISNKKINGTKLL